MFNLWKFNIAFKFNKLIYLIKENAFKIILIKEEFNLKN